MRSNYASHNGLYHYIQDQVYSVRAILDAAGSVVERTEYTPCGVATVYNASFTPTPTFGNQTRFTGRAWDTASNTYYYRNLHGQCRSYSTAVVQRAQY